MLWLAQGAGAPKEHAVPERINAYFTVVSIAVATFFVIRGAGKQLLGTEMFSRQRNLWLAFTSVGFLSPNFWIFAGLSVVLLLYASGKEPLKPAIFALLVVALPDSVVNIAGFGPFKNLFGFNAIMLLSVVVLLPLIITDQTKRHTLNLTDLLVLTYIVLQAILVLRESTLTNAFRVAFVQVLLTYIPYLVLSRKIHCIKDMNTVLATFVVGMLIMSMIAAFETFGGRLLYLELAVNWGTELTWGLSGAYLSRGALLRAWGAAGGPIILGFLFTVAVGFMLSVSRETLTRGQLGLCFSMLMVGLLCTLSRGPWVAAAGLIILYSAMQEKPAKRVILTITFLLGVVLAVDLIYPSAKLVEMLPFVGDTVHQGSIRYRQQLFEVSFEVIQENLLFGSPAATHMANPLMRQLVQGQGIIDLVNTYITIALQSGIIGLTLFCAIFISTLLRLWIALSSLPRDEVQLRQTGTALFATLAAILVTIATVSFINSIPVVTFMVTGLCVAQTRIIQYRLKEMDYAPGNASRGDGVEKV